MNQQFSSHNSEIKPIDILPDNKNPLMRLNTICPYYTMFPLDFPFQTLSNAKKGDWVLDPFCGRGTTNYAARLRGLGSVGIDTSPVAAAISAAKLVYTTPKKIIRLSKEILNDENEPQQIPEGRFWELCYSEETLNGICKIREALLTKTFTDDEIVLRALMLGILHGPLTKNKPSYLSNQMPRTYCCKPDYSVRYWEKNGLLPKNVNVLDLITRRAEYSLINPPPPTPGFVACKDSRRKLPFVPDDGFQWVITSPPYYKMKTYVQDQWLRNWFLGGDETVNYSTFGQIVHTNKNEFTRDLAQVWTNITEACAAGARMIIRLGSLPSSSCNPCEILQDSFDLADCGWNCVNIGDAGIPKRGRRQSDHFGTAIGRANAEIDYYAVLT